MVDNTRIPEEQIAKRAYELYLTRGQKDGAALQDWLDAKVELLLQSVETLGSRRLIPATNKSQRAAA
jgi:hypothetical protein